MADSKNRLNLTGAFVCAVLFLLGYPSLLMLVHDLPRFPSLGFRRLLEPVGPPRFPFEELGLALVYISSFLFAYTFLFGREAKVQFVLLSLPLSLIGYGIGVYLTAETDFLQLCRFHVSCVSKELVCYPYLAHGVILSCATALSIIFSERILRRWGNRDVFGHPATRFPTQGFSQIACLISPIIVYPALLMLLNEPSSLAHFWTSVFVAPPLRFHSAYSGPVAVLATAMFSTLILTILFVRNNRNYAIAAMIIALTVVLFYMSVFLDIYLSVSIGRRFACTDRGLHACLSYLERGVLLAFTFVCATILLERSFRHFGRSAIYQDTE